jgi:beta-lactamase superfamily II metal-dependent hydrolase
VISVWKLLASFFLATIACASVFAADTLDVYFIDVGAGDAILIRRTGTYTVIPDLYS